MTETETRHLRVLIANEKRERLELLAQVVAGLGHEVIAREIYVKEVGAVTARERPDVALVGLGLHSEHALELISEIVRESSCPVIALLSAKDPAYVGEAAKRGVCAYIVDGSPEELQSAMRQATGVRSRRRRAASCGQTPSAGTSTFGYWVADPTSSGSAPRPSSPISGPSRARIPSSAGFWSAGPAEHWRWSSSTAIQSFCARH
jgi:DNA-binding NtrC family response regulator